MELQTKWFDIIDQIPPFTLISLVAGEVLLRKDFEKIYERASQKFRKVTIGLTDILKNGSFAGVEKMNIDAICPSELSEKEINNYIEIGSEAHVE